MKLSWRITRTVHSLGAAGFALLAFGCADQQATAPPSLKPTLNISKGTDFDATIESVITLYEKDGKSRRYKHSQKVKAKFVGGSARASLASPVSSQAKGNLVVPSWRANDVSSEAEGVILTPVLALVDGQLTLDYDETSIDDSGNQVRLVGIGPLDNSPITDVWGYVNGQLVSHKHSTWSRVDGGYVLVAQSLTGYSGGSVVTGQVESKVNGATLLTTSNASLGARFASFPQKALTKVVCWLAPQSAYAQGSCGYQGWMFAGATVGLGIATATPISGALAVTGYLLGWAGWTDSMYSFLKCATGKQRGAGGGVGKGGGGGGGSGFPALY